MPSVSEELGPIRDKFHEKWNALVYKAGLEKKILGHATPETLSELEALADELETTIASNHKLQKGPKEARRLARLAVQGAQEIVNKFKQDGN